MLRYFRRRRPQPDKDPTSIGRIIIDLGYATKEQVSRALEAQKGTNERLCDVLRELGSMTEWQASNAVDEQRIRRGKVTVRERLRIQQERNQQMVKRMIAGHK